MATLGILGGMGPLASAAFLDTLYRLNTAEPEQGSPVCVVLSDPTFPDRTTAILKGETGPLAARLAAALERLLGMDADRILIACVTIHHLLPGLPAALRERVISLIDLVVDEVLRSPRPLLLLTTSGTRAARIFESHERWRLVEPWVDWPDEADQGELHDWIYRLKANQPLDGCLPWLAGLAAKHRRDGFIFGCTELHLLHKALAKDSGADPRVVDPLWIAARDLDRLLG
ncbi:MAG TPA: aspartate/glutamate racemase family protein [Thermoanaerobaculia bacterium]|jgi:aspartate racemase|nr:aspartate/glutamate racemase family protein [Thermoanaerobaculia bacterium]